MGSQRRTVVAVLLVLAALAAGPLAACTVIEEPAAADWDHSAERALSDMASEVGSARLALDTARRERLWPPYALVLVTEAEEAAGTVEEDLSRLQVPPQREQQAEQVLDLLAVAVTTVSEARSRAVEGRYDDPALLDRMERLASRLTGEAGRYASG